MPPYVDIESISELHEFYGVGKPKHPLITVIDVGSNQVNRPKELLTYRLSFYTIFCKKFTGTLKYGRSYYDFREGSLMFTAPGQVVTASPDMNIEEGWGLFFHPDLVNTGVLGRKMIDYTFFQYEANEALHVSEDEKDILTTCIQNIRKEYLQNIDKHTTGLIQANIELLLNYCSRFYDRQFYSREKVNTDVVQQFEKLIKDYFAGETPMNSGLPNVGYFASRMNLSPNYLSDLLHRFTGKTTQEHIHLEMVEKAKSLLWSTQKSVSEIAYTLGFEHPSHFTRLFKSKTGYAPSDYRHLN
ncbi:AraC family transcriptional regulator [Mucilaginibacter sp. SG564]|uniref:helix-turn-helix domain-containing protein n=1 Tax=Mucilaginibacter sp. SG564 TaxID=2587022 RepID=UPI0015555DB3|nr:helix-turn-helix domain-containing protein [Mucilaginibacter sp. SG564]NOW97633.1 AraC-like DNA-binding protein [Mucilaginibacter sp. SG564]